MPSLTVPDNQRSKLSVDLKSVIKSQLPVLDSATQPSAILSHHQSQVAFQRSARTLDCAVERIGRYHRSGYTKIPTPTQQGTGLTADHLAADGSPGAIVSEIEGIRDSLSGNQAQHFVDISLTGLANLGSVGVVEELDNSGFKIRYCDAGVTLTIDAIPNRQTTTTHLVSFTKRLATVLGKELSELMEVSSAICLQASDENGNTHSSPQQFLVARLGPYAIPTSPRLVRKPSLFSRDSFAQPFLPSGLHGTRRPSLAGTAKFVTFTVTLGLLGVGFVVNSGFGSASLVAGALLSVGGCVFALSNDRNHGSLV